MVPVDLWRHQETGTTDEASKNMLKLMGAAVFDFPKPFSLLKKMLRIASRAESDDVILDFFAGSGTTAHAVMAQNAADGGNRQYICVQMPEATPEGSEARKAGYETVSDIAIERIKRAAAKIQEEHPDYDGDLGVRVYRATDSHFPVWQAKAYESNEALKQAIIDYVNTPPQGTPRERADEVLLKLGYPLTTPLTDRGGWYQTENGELALVLDAAFKAADLATVLEHSPTTVVVIEGVFDKDEEKINFELRCQEQKVIFQTI